LSEEIENRLALIEARLEQLYDHLDLTPRDEAEGELDAASDPEIQDLLAKGNTEQAAKRYHERTGVSLDEAKRRIDRAQA
jgi:ribosomal protein L7/L12